MKLPDAWSRATPVFDDENLVSCAGLVPVMALAEQAGLSELIGRRVRFKASRVASAGVNPAGKLTSIVAGMAAGADSIDDLDVIRSGGMPRLFGGVYAPAPLGQFLREFSHGHTLQLASVLRAHLVNLVQHSEVLPGIGEQAFIDIDSLLRPVFGHAKQGASYGHTKIAGKQVLRKGLSPLATTISTSHGAPVLAGIRLRAGRAGSARGRRRWSTRRSVWPVRAGLARDDDYASLGKPPCDWDDPAAREALVDALVRDAHAALAVLHGHELAGPVAEAAELLALVAGQDVEAGEDGMFRIVRRVARDRIISTGGHRGPARAQVEGP